MYKPVQYGVSQSGITYQVMPFIDGELACNQCRGHGVSVLQDLKEVMSAFISHLGKAPVIKEQEFCFCKIFQDFSVSSISFSNMEFLKDSGYPDILDSIPLPAGLLSQGTCKEGLACAGGACNKEIVAVFYPCLLYTSPSPRDRQRSRMPSSA